MGERFRQFVERLKRDSAAQKKKAAVLAVLFLVLLIAVVRLLAGGGAAPETVKAATPIVPRPSGPKVVAPKPKAVQPGIGRKGDVATPEHDDSNDNPHRVINMSGLPRTLARDPFRSTSWFEKLANDGSNKTVEPSFLQRITAQWSEYQSQVDAKEKLADRKLGELQLQSTMIGPVNSAYISGHLVHEGDTIGEFSVVRIEARRVILSFSGVKRSLSVR